MRYFLIASIIFLFSGCVSEPTPPTSKSCITGAQLNTQSYDYLARVAKQLKEDQKNVESFEVFINVLKGTVDEYSSMVKSSIYISNVVRFLPIPYAGEVSNSAKLVSKTILSLGNSASALNKYKKSSTTFLEGFSKLDRTNASSAELSKLSVYADTQVLSDARELQNALETISSSTTSLSSATQSIADALETTGGYMNQAKSLVGISPASDDKNKVIESHTSINARMVQLNQKITSLQKSGEMQRENTAKARIYAELALNLELQH